MQLYSQSDPRWQFAPLGFSSLTIGADGCLLTALSSLVDKTPPQVNTLLRQAQAFSGALIIPNLAAKTLGLLYDATFSEQKFTPTIGCTDFFEKTNHTQHFFIVLDAQKILDPLDGTIKTNPYPIRSFINITPKGDTLTEDHFTALALPEALLYWESHHAQPPAQPPIIADIEKQLRQVYQGSINYTDLLDSWRKGL